MGQHSDGSRSQCQIFGEPLRANRLDCSKGLAPGRPNSQKQSETKWSFPFIGPLTIDMGSGLVFWETSRTG